MKRRKIKKYYKNNVEGTKNLLLSCINTKVKNIIFSSSCSVYGDIKGAVNEKQTLEDIMLTRIEGEDN